MLTRMLNRLQTSAESALIDSGRYFAWSSIISIAVFTAVFLLTERSLLVAVIFVPAMTFGVSIVYFIAHFFSKLLFGRSLFGVGILLTSFAVRLFLDVSAEVRSDFAVYRVDAVSIFGDVATLGLLAAGVIVIFNKRQKA